MSSIEMTRPTFDAKPDETRLFVVSTDLELRHGIAAQQLGLHMPDNIHDWYDAKQGELMDMMAEAYDGNVLEVAGLAAREKIGSIVSDFRQNAIKQNETPFVLSLDPVFFDSALADYTFQETRASIVSCEKHYIDLEHNPRTHVNRFLRTGVENDGAGKSKDQQLQEIDDLLNQIEGPIALAFVEDYINEGRSLRARFSKLLQDPRIDSTIIVSVANARAHASMGEAVAILPAVAEIPEPVKLRHMDMSDILPSLGGRAVGQEMATHGAELYTVGDGEQATPMTVDAICGNYPWQVDIYRHTVTPAFIEKLGAFCLTTSVEFWESLEQMAGQKLTWRDLRPLNGVLRVGYPGHDLATASVPADSFKSRPLDAVHDIIKRVDK